MHRRKILQVPAKVTRTAFSVVFVFGLFVSMALAQGPLANEGDLQTKPELVIQTGHTSLVNSVAFSPEGRILASGGGDNAVRIWDAESGRQIKGLVGHSSYVLAVAFSPDGEKLASGGFDNTVKLWDSRTGTLVKSLEGHAGGIFSLAFSPNGKMIASGSKDSTIKLWEVETGRQVKSFTGHAGYVFSVAFSPDGKTLASGSPDGTIRLWDLETGSSQTLEGQAQEVWSVAFSPVKKTLASANTDGTIKLWDLATGTQTKSINTQSSILYSVTFSPDGKMLASGSTNNTIKLWDVETGKEIRSLDGHTSVIKALAFSKDGDTLLSGSSDNTIRLWNVPSGRELRSLASRATHVLAVTVSNDGKLLASINFNNTIKVWNVETGQQIRSLEYDAKGVNNINTIAFSPDGNTLASGHKDETIRLWDVKTGEPLKILEGVSAADSQGVNKNRKAKTDDPRHLNITGKWSMKVESQGLSIPVALELTQDGETLRGVFSSHAGGGTIPSGLVKGNVVTGVARVQVQSQVVELKLEGSIDEGKLNGRLIGSGLPPISFTANRVHEIYSVAYSPDGKMLASGGEDNIVRLWVIATGQEVRSFESHVKGVNAVAFSPDGGILASGSKDSTITLWNVNTGEEIKSLLGHLEQVASVKFSPDGATLASGSFDETVKLWDIKTGQISRSLTGRTGRVHSVAYSSDGQKVASGGDDGTITLWDSATGTRQTLAGHSKEVSSVFFAAKQDLLFSASWDATVKLWRPGIYYPLATLVSIDNDDWAVTTPPGLFDASAPARKLMHYVIGLEPISLDQMKDVYYVPGLLQKIFKGEPLPKVELFGKQNLFPRVEYEPLKPQQKQLTVKLTNRGGGIGPVQVLFNGKELVADARPKGFNPNSPNATLTIDLTKAAIKKGDENKIEIISRNTAGSLSTRDTKEAELIYKDESTGPIDPPNIYAIVGGVSEYTGDKLKLNFAAKDAEDFARALELGAIKLLNGDKSKVHIRLLTSNGDQSNIKFHSPNAKVSTATKADFAQAFSDFRNATSKDVFIVYLAGHGVSLNLNQNPNQAGGDTYLYLTQEATTTDKSVLGLENARKAMAISSEELKELMKQNKALKQVLILDTCAAGALSDSLVGKRDLPSDQIRAIERLKDNTGFFVLMGASADAVSYEASRYGQGLLTYSLLQGMKGARLRENQFADVGLLFGYAQETVPQMAKNIGGIQRPLIITPDTSSSFDIGKFTTEEQKQINLSTPKPIILRPNLRNSSLRFDNLKLTQMMTEQLRHASYVQARGEQSQIVFVEADEMTDAVQPVGDYMIEADTLKVSVILVKNDVPFGEEITVTGSVGGPRAVIKQLIEAITQSLLVQPK